jgi:hypothetical protein
MTRRERRDMFWDDLALWEENLAPERGDHQCMWYALPAVSGENPYIKTLVCLKPGCSKTWEVDVTPGPLRERDGLGD